MPLRPHILHVFSTFEPGGPEVRTVNIINSLGSEYTHTIIATDGRYGARGRLLPTTDVALPPPPEGKGRLWYGLRFRQLLRVLRPSLLITYNWGAIDALIGAHLSPVCPAVHAEDGFGPEEARGLKRRRVWTRRILLRATFATVVPSRTLLNIARSEYRLSEQKVRLIRNGIDVRRFRPERSPAWRRERGVPDSAVLVGFVGALRAEKRLDHLLRAAASVSRAELWVALVGDGACRDELHALSRDLGIHDRVVFAGEVVDPAPAYAAFDVFAMSSTTEQMPVALLEAMAAGLPAVCTDVGDTRDLLADAEFVVPRDDLESYARRLVNLVTNSGLRATLGARNRQRSEAEFSYDTMLAAYRQLYEAAILSGRNPARIRARIGDADRHPGKAGT
jgi:glycosyltransferase involved in cell wall biosynthesis